MRGKFLLLFVLFFLLTPSVYADGDDDDDEETIFGIEAEGLGDFALYLMGGSLAIVAWKPTFHWLRKNGPERFNVEARPFKKKLGIFNRRFMKVHTWLGFGAAILGTIHGIVLEWHWTLWVGMGAIWLLVISGSMMQWRWPTKEVRKGARLLHLQRTLTIVAIVLLWVGHNIVD